MADTTRVLRIEISRAVAQRLRSAVAALQPQYPWITFGSCASLAVENMVLALEALNRGKPFPDYEDELRPGRPPPKDAPLRAQVPLALDED